MAFLVCRQGRGVDSLYLDSGGADITHTVRIKCAAKECPEVDLCPSCFSKGEEKDAHKAWHDYKIVVSSPAENYTLSILVLNFRGSIRSGNTLEADIYGRLGCGRVS